MSDDNSIGGAFKDLAKETAKQVVMTPVSIIKAAGQQVIGVDSEEEEMRKKAEHAATHQRIKEIEAEMEQIRKENARKTGPQIANATQSGSDSGIPTKNSKSIDEASRQAVGRAEQGRNFKG